MVNLKRILDDDEFSSLFDVTGKDADEAYSSLRNGRDNLEPGPGIQNFSREADMDLGYEQDMTRFREMPSSLAEPMNAISDPGDIPKSNFLPTEKTDYKSNDFDRRYVSKAGDTMTALFKREYGYTPSAGELIQYANLNGMSSPHQLAVNQVIKSPDIDSLHEVQISRPQMDEYLSKDAQFKKNRDARNAFLAEQHRLVSQGNGSGPMIKPKDLDRFLENLAEDDRKDSLYFNNLWKDTPVAIPNNALPRDSFAVQYAQAFGNKSKAGSTYHNYSGLSPASCDVIEDWCNIPNIYNEGLLYNGAPGQEGKAENGKRQRLTGGNDIVQALDPENHSLVNITQPGHVMRNGIVTRMPVRDGNKIRILTWGVGQNVDMNYGPANILSSETMANINHQVGKPNNIWYIFKDNDEKAFERAKKTYDLNKK